jgi:hypothetical protein
VHYAPLGAASAAQPATSLELAAHELERRMSRAAKAVGYNTIFRNSLPSQAATLLDGSVGPAASPEAIQFAKVARALANGKAVLQPYTVAPSPDIHWGVTLNKGASLGWWPVAVQVLKLAGQAALVSAGFVLVDGYNTTQKVEADAELVRANTEKVVAGAATKLQETDPEAASKMLALVLGARKKAEDDSDGWGWLDTAGRAALGIGAGALLAVGAFYLLGKRSSSSGRKRNPSSSRDVLLALAGAALSSSSTAPDLGWAGGPMYVDTSKARNDYLAIAVPVALLWAAGRRKRNPRRRRRMR